MTANSPPIRVGTRGSALARLQTEEVLDALRAAHPGLDFQTNIVRTQGDVNATAPLAGMGLGVFVKEIEQQLLSGRIDLAVHSLKDMPTALPEGLTIGAVLRRQDPRDVQVNKWDLPLADLPADTRIGTSSPRRMAQLKHHHPALQVAPLRGNVETRLNKIQAGECDGAVLAAAGLIRLDLDSQISEHLDPTRFVPPPGQGALAVEIRADDGRMAQLLTPAEHPETRLAVTAERAFLETLGGGCQVPVGAYAVQRSPGRVTPVQIGVDGDAGTLTLTVFVGSPDGSEALIETVAGPTEDPGGLARRAFQSLVNRGARQLLEGADK